MVTERFGKETEWRSNVIQLHLSNLSVTFQLLDGRVYGVGNHVQLSMEELDFYSYPNFMMCSGTISNSPIYGDFVYNVFQTRQI